MQIFRLAWRIVMVPGVRNVSRVSRQYCKLHRWSTPLVSSARATGGIKIWMQRSLPGKVATSLLFLSGATIVLRFHGAWHAHGRASRCEQWCCQRARSW